MVKRDGQASEAAGRRERQKAIGGELRRTFQSVEREETPERLRELAERLERELADGAPRGEDGER